MALDNKIKLHINTNNNETINIPKFSIQLLVENAIKHGYQNKVLNIYIDITDTTIKVTNDGKIIEIVKFGTGLSNLNTRLKLLHVGTLEHNITDMMNFIIHISPKKDKTNENINS